MKKRLRMILTAGLLCAVLGGCGSSAKEVTIELKENPTTGYQWEYTMEPEGVLKELSSEYIQQKTGLTGAPGRHVWKFGAAGDGDVTITFTYRRPWEEPKPENKTEVYQYQVSSGRITEKK